MGIYGSYANRLIENIQIQLLENSFNDNNIFFESLDLEPVNESLSSIFGNVIKRIKDMVDKFINFIKSIPGTIVDIINKIFKKDKGSNKIEFPEDIDPDIEYDKPIINYPTMIYDIYDDGLLGSYYNMDVLDSVKLGKSEKDLKDLENNFGKAYMGSVSNRFNNIKTSDEFLKYIRSEEFKENYIFKDLHYSTLKEACKDLEDNQKFIDKIIEYIEFMQKQAESYSKKIDKVISSTKDDEEIVTNITVNGNNIELKDNVLEGLRDSAKVINILQKVYVSILLCVKNWSKEYSIQMHYVKSWIEIHSPEHGKLRELSVEEKEKIKKNVQRELKNNK